MNCELLKLNIDRFFGIDISSKTRTKCYFESRYMYIYLAMKYASDGLTYSRIGSVINRDHSTVIHGYKKCKDYLVVDAKFRDKLNKLESFINKIIYNENLDKKEPPINLKNMDMIMLKKKYIDLHQRYNSLKSNYIQQRKKLKQLENR